MNYKENYKILLEKLKGFGVAEKLLQSLSFYSLSNEAKLRAELKKFLTPKASPTPPKEGLLDTEKNSDIHTTHSLSKGEERGEASGEASGLITDFPLELHWVYRQKKELFLQACSLKIILNSLADSDTENALKIQQQIFNLFEKMDSLSEILDHWTAHKRILKLKTDTDFSLLSPMDLLQKRNTLRSNLTSRKKTLEKLKATNDNSLKMKDKIIKKQEEIKEIELQVEKLNSLIKEK